ncbi:flocculation protein FLO11-like, partial [Fagus crenata]
MPGLRVEPPSNFRILRNVASGNGYGSRQRAGYVEWHEEKSSWKVFGTHLPPGWASTHSTFIEDEGDRSKKGKRVAEESPIALIDPFKEGKKKARVHVVLATSFPIPSIDVFATSEPVSPPTVVTKGSARRTRNKSPCGKSPSRGKETSAKAVKAFVGDVDAVVDVENALAEEGVHINATTRELSTLNESNINIYESEGLADPARGGLIVKGSTIGIDLDIDLEGNNGVETIRAQTELALMAGVETHNDSICDDVIIVPPHASPTTHDSLGIKLTSAIESTRVAELATIAGRPAEEVSRPFNSNDYFARLGVFLDTIRPSCVGLPMARDRLIAHAAPASEEVVDPNNLALIPHGGTLSTVSGDGTSFNDSEGLKGGMLDQDAQDPYDDMDDNLVVRGVSGPFSGEMVDTSSSSGNGVEVSPARGDDFELTLRVPFSRLHEGSMWTVVGKGTSASFPLVAGRVGLSERNTIFATEGLTQFLEDSTKEIYNDHSPRHFWVFKESFVSFLRFQVPSGCLPILESLHKRFGNFTSDFKFGCGSGSFYLHLLSGVLCDMRRTPLELVTEGKLQDWRGVARELIDLGFAVDFLLERIREVAHMYFGRKVCAETEAIDAQITYYKEQIVQLEAKKNGLPPIVPLGNLSAGC